MSITNLELDIVGDGPEESTLKSLAKGVEGIHFHGAQNQEEILSNYFEQCSLVFIPGHTGLSINHAFLYGRGYITLDVEKHARKYTISTKGTMDTYSKATNWIMLTF